MRNLLCRIAILFILPAAAAAATPSRLPTADDFGLMAGVGAPAISPDGNAVALVISHTVWSDDRRTRDLVLVNLGTHATRTPLHNRADLSDPAYSPDGTQLAYLARAGTGDDAQTQLFVMPARGGASRQVTHVGAGVDGYAWRPDGRAFALACTTADPKRKGADRFRDSFIFTTEPITADSEPKPDHLYTIALAGGAATQLTFGTHDDEAPSWSPDGRSIAFTQSINAIANDSDTSHAAIVDVSSKSVRALTNRTLRESDPIFSPDGKHVAYFYTDGDDQISLSQLYLTTPAGGIGTNLTASIDRPIGAAVWASDSQSLIVTAPDGLTNALYRVALDGTVSRLEPGDVTPGIPLSTTGGSGTPSLRNALARNGTLAFVGSWTNQPPELYTFAPGKTAEKITNFNVALSRFAWTPAERITFPTTTGVTGDGLLYLPPHFDPSHKYPVVVYIHGGPGDPTQRIFDFFAQVMAARGWLVLRPNYRGSPNLGYVYQHAILYDPEDGPGKDIVAALDVVRARGIVDESRIAVSGWSYGGIMTAWLISKYHFWRAAVSGASVNDWITDYGTADDSGEDLALLHGSPFVGNNAPEWHAVSAISYVADVTTPVLILSDNGDNRDPFATSSMYWRALRDNGKDATLRVWPVAGHFPSDPVRTADIYNYWIGYIAAHFR